MVFSTKEDIICQELCHRMSTDLSYLSQGLIAQSCLLIRLAGRLHQTWERDGIITIVACWVHSPEIDDNLFTVTEELCKGLVLLK